MATTRDNATGSRTEVVVAVTARRAAAVPAGAPGAGDPGPISEPGEAGASLGGGDTGCGVLAVGCTGAALADGEGRACGDVQPVIANNANTTGPTSIGQRSRRRGRLLEITNLTVVV